MSNAIERLKSLTNIAFGVASVAQGNWFGTKDIVLGLFDIIQLGRSVRGKTPDGFQKIDRKILDQIHKIPEFKTADLSRIETPLDDTDSQIWFSSKSLVDAAQNSSPADLPRTLADRALKDVPFDGDDPITKNTVGKILEISFAEILALPDMRHKLEISIVIELLQQQARQVQAAQKTANKAQQNHAELLAELSSLRSLIDIIRTNRLFLDRFPAHKDQQLSTFVSMSFNERRTEFVGREAEHKAIQEFLDDDRHLLWWQVAGSAGQGKSRLALHIIDHIDPSWNAGFLDWERLESVDWTDTAFDEATLIVIDYVGGREKVGNFANALGKLEKRFGDTKLVATKPAGKIRFLLLEREAFSLQDTVNPQNWIAPVLKDPRTAGAVLKWCFNDGALVLQDLSVADMRAIAQS